MTPDNVALIEFACAFADKVKSELPGSGVHPSGTSIVHELLGELYDAAARNNATAVAFVIRSINRKIATEMAWHGHCQRSAQRENRRRDDAGEVRERETQRILVGLQHGSALQALKPAGVCQ